MPEYFPLVININGEELYRSQPKQSEFHTAIANRHLTGQRIFLGGGSAGGGKSLLLRWIAHNECLNKDQPRLRVLLLRGTFAELETTHIDKVQYDFPPGVIKYNTQKRLVTYLPTGSTLRFGYGKTAEDFIQYLSTEYDIILVDELTTIPFALILQLMSRLRTSQKNFKPFFAAATNPGSVSHNEVKSYFLDKDFNIEFPDMSQRYNPDEVCFIKFGIFDNAALMKVNPDYIKILEGMSPNDVKRFRDGSWDIFEGQFFEKFSRDIHEVDFAQNNIVIQSHWPQLIGLDHGNTTVAYKVAINPKTGIHYVIWEWKEEKLEDSELANSFWNHLVNHGDTQTPVYYDTSMSAQNVNLKAANIPSAVNIFKKKGIIMRPVVKSGDPDRNMKFREACNSRIKDLLNWSKDKNGLWLKKPKILFNKDRNPYLMKSMPKLQYNPSNDRDIYQDAKVDDHGYDALKYAVISHSLPRDVQAQYAAMQKAQKEQYSR